MERPLDSSRTLSSGRGGEGSSAAGRARQDIVVYGAGGVAREVHQTIKTLAVGGAPVACAGFLVDAGYRRAATFDGLPVFGDASWLADHPDVSVVIAIGPTAPRRRVARSLAAAGAKFCTLIDPRGHVGDDVTLGDGSFVSPGAVATAAIAIGDHGQLHAGCTIGHDTTLAALVTVTPGAHVAGRISVGEGVFIGIGAVILPDLTIGEWSVIGGGSVVTRSVPANVTVAGNPARIIEERPAGWHLES
jgi:sugar O-acyltransferase (sialic acid O-acetyltransferase NeuD family)